MSADSPKLEARGVGKNFGSLRAVSDVSMKVAHGDVGPDVTSILSSASA